MKMSPADILEYPIPKVGNFTFLFLGKTLDEIQTIQKSGYGNQWGRSYLAHERTTIFKLKKAIGDNKKADKLRPH